MADVVQLGPRPFYLLERMQDSALKRQLQTCARDITQYRRSDFSIGHRGAPLQFPEHTRESYTAAARMGAGIVECDVTFTKDKALVCRHAQCDLHTTTNILATPLAAKCSVPFTPATFNAKTGERTKAATARCCASDITLAEFKTLVGKMDSFNADARGIEEYLGGTANFRTDLYATGGTLMTHAESIELFRSLGVRMTPELKSPEVPMPFDGLTRQDYARRMIGDYIGARVPPTDVFAQSFDLNDVLTWIEQAPEFGRQAIWLDGRDPRAMHTDPPTLEEFGELRARGLTTIAPPIVTLLKTARLSNQLTDADAGTLGPRNAKGHTSPEDAVAEPSAGEREGAPLACSRTDETCRAGGNEHEIEPSTYALRAHAAGLRVVTWTVERSGRIAQDVLPAGGAFYYSTIADALVDDGDVFRVVHALNTQVGVAGLFSDWPATTTFYANCMAYQEDGLRE